MNRLSDAYLDTLHDEGPRYTPVEDPTRAYLNALHAEGFEPPTYPDNAILDLDLRLTQLEQQIDKLHEMMTTQLAINTRLIGAMQEQSTVAPQSAIILPDRFN